MYGEFSRPELSIAPVLVGATRRPRILGWCRGNFTFPHQSKEWAQYVSEATAQYCRLQSWRAEQAQATDEDGSFPLRQARSAIRRLWCSLTIRRSMISEAFSPSALIVTSTAMGFSSSVMLLSSGSGNFPVQRPAT